MRRRWTAILATVAAALGAPAAAGAALPPAVQATIDGVLAKPLYAPSTWGFAVVDAQTGATVYEHNADKLFVPGSIFKTFSAAHALHALGPDHRFRTPVHRRGVVRRGVLRGDLVLVGAGDLSLGLRERPDGTMVYENLPELDHNEANIGTNTAVPVDGNPLAGLNRLARQVRAKGIRRVTGDVVVDDRLFTPQAWPDGTIHSIWVNENVVDVETIPTRPGQRARAAWRPRSAAFRVDMQARTVAAGGETDLRLDEPRPGVIRVRGTVAADVGRALRTHLVEDPARFARTLFIEALRRHGVRVDARAVAANPVRRLPARRSYPARTRVAVHTSARLAEFVKVIMKVSYNRGADMLVCLTAVAAGSRDCTEGLRRQTAVIGELGATPETTFLFDGAGSDEQERTSPRAMVTFMRNVLGRPYAGAFVDALPILGRDGTLANVAADSPAAGHVRAKTGSRAGGAAAGNIILTGITQVGYIHARSGRRYVYAEMVRDVGASSLPALFAVPADQGAIVAALQQGL